MAQSARLPLDFEAVQPRDVLAEVLAIDLAEVTAADLPALSIMHTRLQQARGFDASGHQQDELLGIDDAQQRLQRRLRELMRNLDDRALRRLALGDDKTTFGEPFFFDALCYRWIAREVAKVVRSPKRKLAFPEPPQPYPKEWDAFFTQGPNPAEFHRGVGPYLRLVADARKSLIGLSVDRERYDKLLRAFFADSSKNTARELLRFTSDSTCGTGASAFFTAQNRAAFMSLLRGGRIEEALGASFFVPSEPEWMREPARPFDTWRVDLLKYCGFDWENVLITGQLPPVLAAHGSGKGARYAMHAMRTLEHPDPWDFNAVVAFLAPHNSSSEETDDPRRKLSPDVQNQLFAFIDEAVRQDLSFWVLRHRLRVLAEIDRRETKPTLFRLLQHPSPTYAEKAAEILRNFGEPVARIPQLLPARFRFFRNGKPWPGTKFTSASKGGEGDRSLIEIKTDGEGFAEIPRDEFLDPEKRGPLLVFSQSPLSIINQSGAEQEYDEPWVETRTPMPQAFDEVIKVDFEVCPLSVEISYHEPRPPSIVAPTHLRVALTGAKEPFSGFGLTFDANKEPPARLTLNALSPRSYQVHVLVPGSARFVTPPFELKAGMPPLKVTLEKGSHIYASLVAPWNGRGLGEIRLLQEGRDITDEYRAFHLAPHALFAGVPKGRYQLRVLSTAEFMAKHKISEWKASEYRGVKDPRAGVDCEGATVDFDIDNQSPPLIDLGRIEVRPVPAMKGKASGEQVLTSPAPPEAEPPR